MLIKINKEVHVSERQIAQVLMLLKVPHTSVNKPFIVGLAESIARNGYDILCGYDISAINKLDEEELVYCEQLVKGVLGIKSGNPEITIEC